VDPELRRYYERHASAPTEDEPDNWVQMNVRIRRSMLNRLDGRRHALDLSRDDWIRYVVEWALLQPPGTHVRARQRRPR
jgi:hypothetical protein